MTRLALVDKSAWAIGSVEPTEDLSLCLCEVIRLELLYSTRSSDEYEQVAERLGAFRDLQMDRSTFATASAAQRELANRGRHRVPIPDLLIAACAQQHGADVIHVDRHFDTLAEVLAFNSVRAS